jgi:hypothetical protein
MLVLCAFPLFGAVAIGSAQSQADGRAAANQLHAAIVNGDLESLRYWLDVRHADPTVPDDAEPDLTPIARCVRMAARVLDASSSDDHAAPAVGLRVLQDMVLLLHQHKAQLSAPERKRFSGPALRWYDDAVALPRPAAKPQASADSGPVVQMMTRANAVVVAAGPRRCNGAGHLVYLTNHNALPITATVEIVEDSTGTNPTPRTEDVTVGPENSWELGCDASKAGRPVSYVLKGWR